MRSGQSAAPPCTTVTAEDNAAITTAAAVDPGHPQLTNEDFAATRPTAGTPPKKIFAQRPRQKIREVPPTMGSFECTPRKPPKTRFKKALLII